MNKSAIRSVAIFAAGAATAVLAGEYYPRPAITLEEFQVLGDKLLPQVETMGYYIGKIERGRLGIYTDPYACVPNPPLPKMPAKAVNLFDLQSGVEGLVAMNQSYLMDEPLQIYVIGKCRPYASSTLSKY
jgi:hypothetical protein